MVEGDRAALPVVRAAASRAPAARARTRRCARTRSATATSRPRPRVLRGALSAIRTTSSSATGSPVAAAGRAPSKVVSSAPPDTRFSLSRAAPGTRSWLQPARDSASTSASRRTASNGVTTFAFELGRGHARERPRHPVRSPPRPLRRAPGLPLLRRVRAVPARFRKSRVRPGWLRLLLLELDGEAVAAEFGFLFHGVYFAYQGARNPTWQRESVGFVLEVETIRRSLEEGAVEFRFLQAKRRTSTAFRRRIRASRPFSRAERREAVWRPPHSRPRGGRRAAKSCCGASPPSNRRGGRPRSR